MGKNKRKKKGAFQCMQPQHQGKTEMHISSPEDNMTEDYTYTSNSIHNTCGAELELFTYKFSVTVVGDQLEPFAELNHGAEAEPVEVQELEEYKQHFLS